MSATKDQVPLNGAFYGPSVPPQQYNYQSQNRRRSGCGCLLSTFLKVILVLAIALGVAALVAWLIIRPREVKWYVVGADLRQLNLTNNVNGNTLNYDLSLDFAVRNPNKRIGVYYDRIEATASYKGERFGWDNIPRFYQGHKNTTDLRANFQGQSVIVLSGKEIDQFNEDRNNGYAYIDVKIYLRVRFKIGGIKTRRTKPDVECDLRIPLASANVTTMFATKRCDFDY